MAFSGDTIRKKAKSPKEYELGRAIFCADKVEKISVESFWKGEETIKTLVEDEGIKYRVSLLIKGDCIYRASCACPAHKEYKGLCRHEVAAAFYAMERHEDETTPHVTTSQKVRQMIHTYTNREINDLKASELAEKIHLKPVFRITRDKIYLYLKVGVGRFYLLKDIAAFTDALEGDSYVEYGKQLGFVHSLQAFDEISAKLAEHVSREVEEYRHISERLNPLRGGEHSPIKELELSPGAIDNFMKLLTGQTVDFELADGSCRSLLIQKENPAMFGVIRAYGKDGTRISLMDELHTIKGKKRLYVLRTEHLYICDTKCTNMLGEFLKTLETAPGSGPYMDISQKDLPAFCDYVLPKIKRYIALEPMGIDLGKYHTEPLQTKYYFDTPGDSEVDLRVEFWYGNQCFRPFDKGAVDDLFRDRVGEMLSLIHI